MFDARGAELFGQTDGVARRPLPSDLVSALRRAREVEAAAATQDQHQRAVRATSILAAAAVGSGWHGTEVAALLGISTSALHARMSRVRDAPLVGLDVTPAPPPPTHSAPPLPVEQREWLTANEAMAMARISTRTLHIWFHNGLLPRTRTDHARRLYARADLERIATSPRRGAVGVSWPAVHDAIAAESGQQPPSIA